jgi:hypothetical protein
MKRAAQAVNALVVRIASAIGLEGAFFVIGTALLAAGSSFIHPAGPLFVIGAACVLVSVALTVPERT